MGRTTRAGRALDAINGLAEEILQDPRYGRGRGEPRMDLFVGKVEWVRRTTGADLGGCHADEPSALRTLASEIGALRLYADTAGILRGCGGGDVHLRLDRIATLALAGLRIGQVIDAEPLPEAMDDVTFRP